MSRVWWGPETFFFKLLQKILFSVYYGRAGDGGDDYDQLDGSQCFLLDIMTTQMQWLMHHNNEELYGRIDGLKNQLN